MTEIKLCIGPPGTGKTRHVADCASESANLYGPDRVLIASLTRSAAAECRTRKIPIPSERIGTMHSHCFRALGRPRIAETKIKEFSDEHPAFRLTSADVDDDAPEDGIGDHLYALYCSLRAANRPRNTWPAQVMPFARAWSDWKEQTGTKDFQDLIDDCRDDGGPAPGQPRVIYIDEAQDHSASELDLACRVWGAHTRGVVLVGDPDQAIFTWRGADPQYIARLELPPTRVKVLSQSWRVPRAVHALAALWIARCAGRIPAEYHPRDADGAVLRSLSSWAEPEPLIHEIERRLSLGQTCMYLASCSYMLEPMLAALRRRGVPFANPLRPQQGRWNPLARRRGVTILDRIEAFAALADNGRWTGRDLKRWMLGCRAEGFMKHGKKTWLEESLDDERRVDLALLADLMAGCESGGLFEDHDSAAPAREALDAALRADLNWLRARLLPNLARAAAYPCRVVERARRGGKASVRAVLRERPGLTIGTIHSVKGGEADHVWLAPDLSPAGEREWSERDADSVRRTFYVGMTRARETLTILHPAGAHVAIK